MTYGHRVLCLALATAGATMFVGLWLGIDMMPQRETPVIQAPEPCKQLADFGSRKSYTQHQINQLCERQDFDSRFHANTTRPKRVQPE